MIKRINSRESFMTTFHLLQVTGSVIVALDSLRNHKSTIFAFAFPVDTLLSSKKKKKKKKVGKPTDI